MDEIEAVCGQDYPHPEPSEIGIRDGVRYSLCGACGDEIIEVLYPEHAKLDQGLRFGIDTVQDFLRWLRENGYQVLAETRYGLRGRGEEDDDIHLSHRWAGVNYDVLKTESRAIFMSGEECK